MPCLAVSQPKSFIMLVTPSLVTMHVKAPGTRQHLLSLWQLFAFSYGIETMVSFDGIFCGLPSYVLWAYFISPLKIFILNGCWFCKGENTCKQITSWSWSCLHVFLLFQNQNPLRMKILRGLIKYAHNTYDGRTQNIPSEDTIVLLPEEKQMLVHARCVHIHCDWLRSDQHEKRFRLW